MVVRIKGRRKWRRGHRTYHGSHKKWRGGGSRGGRGKAGMHKHKWSYTVKYEPEHFGKVGFKRPLAIKKEINVINLNKLEELAKKENKTEIELKDFKVLGSGKITQPLVVKAKSFSKSAIKKLEEIGGKAVKLP